MAKRDGHLQSNNMKKYNKNGNAPYLLVMAACLGLVSVSCQPHRDSASNSLGKNKPLIHVAPNSSGISVVKTRYHGQESGGALGTQTLPSGVDLVIKSKGAPSTTIKILSLENASSSDLNPASITQWKNTLASGAVPSKGRRLPSILPTINAGRLLQAKAQIKSYPWGKAAVFLAAYGQDTPRQLGNEDLYLVVQGITSDGRHSLRILMAISHPQLPQSSFSPPPAGKVKLSVTPTPKKAIDWLNAQPGDSFTTSIQQMELFLSALSIR